MIKGIEDIIYNHVGILYKKVQQTCISLPKQISCLESFVPPRRTRYGKGEAAYDSTCEGTTKTHPPILIKGHLPYPLFLCLKVYSQEMPVKQKCKNTGR